MAELVHSIRRSALLQPVVVRRTGPDDVRAGHGRAPLAGLPGRPGSTTIPAIVRETDDDDMLRDALLENLHRSQLNPLEEAAAYAPAARRLRLHPRGAGQPDRPLAAADQQHAAAAEAHPGRPAPGRGRRALGRARPALLAVEDPELQDRLAARVVAEGISVRGLEEIVAVARRDEAPARATVRSKPRRPRPDDLAERLSDRFETRVKVDLGRAKGKITVEFASLDDLQRIVDIMDPRNRNDRPI